MAWPSNKASTTHVSNASNLLHAARSAIKQDIDNVNNIIDEFAISNPQNDQGLIYSTNSFSNTDLFVDTFTSVLQFNQVLFTSDSAGLDDYNGGFTLTGTSVSVTGSQITMPAGDYYVRTLVRKSMTRFADFEFETRWLNVLDDSLIWNSVSGEFTTGAGQTRIYQIGAVVQLAQETTVYMTYVNGDDNNHTHSDLLITRI